MAAGWTQQFRFLNLATPLPDDTLLLRSFTGHEGISQPFRFRLDMLSENPAINFDDMVGQNVTFSVKLADNSKERCFNGFVSRFVQLPGEERLTHYEAEVVPWLWFLTRTSDCRIFQQMSVPAIVEKVFKDFGFTDYENQLQGSYTDWEYCVQYRETAFQFVSRLLEQEGIFYFFKHENGKHILVLGDAPSVHKPCPEQAKVMFERTGGPGVAREEDVIFTWRVEQEFRSGKYAFTDYNFETPATRLDTNVNSQINQGGNQRFEIFDYPGEFETRDAGQKWADIRMEEEEAAHTVISGESVCRALVSGFKFELWGYERRDQNGNYVLTSIDHAAEEGGFYSGAGSGESTYSNSFTAIPAAVRFRPPRITPKHLVYGTQTAVVVGPSGEEIYCDKYGRIKVQFHWDRRGTLNQNSSCWVRVAQSWAGKGWGGMIIPRIGQEVVVAFLEGDPDCPIVVGTMYNAVQTVPYPLPDRQVVSTMRSSSSKGGGNSNEIRLDDTKSKEQIYIHAAYNMDTLVENIRRETVGVDSHELIKGTQYEKTRGDRHVQVVGDLNQKVGQNASLNIGTNRQDKVGQNWAVDAGTEIHLKAGMNVVIESGTTLTLKVGGNFVNINSGGIFIKGSMVMINSGGAAGSGAGSSPTAPKDPEEVQAGAPTQAAPAPPAPRPPVVTTYSPAAAVLTLAARTGRAFCET
jgi:type VI secretion system secreted protein VgrG